MIWMHVPENEEARQKAGFFVRQPINHLILASL